MASEFLKWARKNNLIKPVEEAFKKYPPEEECHKGEISYFIEEESDYCISVGDIVFVSNFKYQNNKTGNNHLFIIIDEDNTVVSLEYFGFLISSRLNKLKYQKNILLKKNKDNKLKKDSIVKTDYLYKLSSDMISYKLSSVSKEQVELFKECVKKNIKNQEKIEKYITKEKSIMDKEFELLQEISKFRKEKKLSQRQLAEILKMKQPMLAKIENNKNSPQLNTLLKILDSLGYTIEFTRK